MANTTTLGELLKERLNNGQYAANDAAKVVDEKGNSLAVMRVGDLLKSQHSFVYKPLTSAKREEGTHRLIFTVSMQ